MAKANLLLVDDDAELAKLVGQAMQKAGYKLRWANNLAKAAGIVEEELPDLVILDRNLPDGDGLELCSRWRQAPRTEKVAVLVLTTRKAVPEKVSGLRMGADDYLEKPFKVTELLARIESILRRVGYKAIPAVQLESGGLRLDLTARKAYAGDKEVPLSHKEFDLLKAFMESPGKALGRPLLLEKVWGYAGDAQPDTKVVDVTLGHLRRKLGGFGDKISAVTGLGYRFDP